MSAGAPRLPWRPLPRFVRGAMLALALVADGPAVQAQGMPPDACEGVFADVWQFCGAYYDDPTTRYPHGVLGDTVEWGALVGRAVMPGHPVRELRLTLDDAHVFEDLEPRLATLALHLAPAVIAIRSHQDLGAQLVIYRPDPENRTFELIAATPYIGRRNRWLAPVGVADFNGDGLVDIAYVDRPHLARTLRIWTFADGELREIANAGGFSNHRIGEDFITGGVRDCGDGPEMVLADAQWRSVVVARMVDGAIEAAPVAAFSPGAVAAALDCR